MELQTLAVSQRMDTEKTLCVWVLLLLNPILSHGFEHFEKLHQGRSRYERIELENSISKLLKHIRAEFTYDHIVVWREHAQTTSTDCIFEDAIKGVLEEPFMVIRNGFDKNEILTSSYTKTILMLSCWTSYSGMSDVKLIHSYFPFLICHVIWVDKQTEKRKVCDSIGPMGEFFSQFVIDNESLVVETIYTCNLNGSDEENFYDMHEVGRRGAVDMQGAEIVTEADQLPPRSILYYDSKGTLQMDGFVANCIKTFAARYNATLTITPPLKLGKAVYYEVLANKTFSGLLDMPAVVIPIKIGSYSDRYYSYPMELMEYCYMIPLPRSMELNQVFTYIVDTHVMVVITILSFVYGILLTIGSYKSARKLTFSNVVLNDKSVRVLLGQSFVMPAKPCIFMQYVCFLLCYTSLIISTTYQAYLQSNLIHPSLEKRVESYEDMRAAGLKIAIGAQESHFVDSATMSMYGDIFKFMESFDDFLKLRTRMDTRYVYPVSSTRWQVFHQQQRLFQRTLFYYSSKLCLGRMLLQSVPFRPDLPYKPLFNQHLLDLRDTGLLRYWINDNFYAMVRLKYTTFEDLSTPEVFGDAIELNDFKWVWIFYAGCLLTSALVFAGEQVYYHIFTKSRMNQ